LSRADSNHGSICSATQRESHREEHGDGLSPCSSFPWIAAECRAVCPLRSQTSISGFASSHSSTTSRLPENATLFSGVHSPRSQLLTFAPACTNLGTNAPLTLPWKNAVQSSRICFLHRWPIPLPTTIQPARHFPVRGEMQGRVSIFFHTGFNKLLFCVNCVGAHGGINDLGVIFPSKVLNLNCIMNV